MLRAEVARTKEIKDTTPIRVSALDTKLGDLGHQLVVRGRTHHCIMCGQSWPIRWKAAMVKVGHCPGVTMWDGPPSLPTIPWTITKGSDIVIRGYYIHRSHRVAVKGPVIFCMRCGRFCFTRMGELTSKCFLRPPNASALRRRNSILEGNNPYSGERLPETTQDWGISAELLAVLAEASNLAL